MDRKLTTDSSNDLWVSRKLLKKSASTLGSGACEKKVLEETLKGLIPTSEHQ